VRTSQQSDPQYSAPPTTAHDLVGDMAAYIDVQVLAEALVEEVVDQAGFVPTVNLCREVWLDFLYCLHEYLRSHASGMITTPEYNAENDEFLAGRRREIDPRPDGPPERGDPLEIERRMDADMDRQDQEQERVGDLTYAESEYYRARRALDDAEVALGQGRDPFPDDPEHTELRLSILHDEVERAWSHIPEEGGSSPLPPSPPAGGAGAPLTPEQISPAPKSRADLTPPPIPIPPGPVPPGPPTPDESFRALESEGDLTPPPIRIRWVKCGEVHVTIDPQRVAKIQYREVPDEEA
jgi:hypothetical protein